MNKISEQLMLQQLKSVYWQMMDSSGKMDFAKKRYGMRLLISTRIVVITGKRWWKSISPMAGLSNCITVVLNRSSRVHISVTTSFCSR